MPDFTSAIALGVTIFTKVPVMHASLHTFLVFGRDFGIRIDVVLFNDRTCLRPCFVICLDLSMLRGQVPGTQSNRGTTMAGLWLLVGPRNI